LIGTELDEMKKRNDKKGVKCRIRRDDIVIAVAGKEKAAGKTGKVLKVISGKGKVIVQGLNYLKKTLRPSQQNPKGGIIDKEASIPISNVMIYCPKCARGVRVGIRRYEDGTKVRFCKRCDETIGKA